MKKDNSGFTLIELIVSLSILIIIVTSFFSMVNTGTKSNTKNEKDIVALNLVQSEIENLRKQVKTNNTSFKSTEDTIIELNSSKSTLVIKEVDGILYNLIITMEVAEKIDEEKNNISDIAYKNLYEVSISVHPNKFSNKTTVITTQISR
ncbi:MAG: prepilin-type N-terminal cleavage/methylation domain-containing protein [Peptostreptococcaceae bacterium]